MACEQKRDHVIAQSTTCDNPTKREKRWWRRAPRFNSIRLNAASCVVATKRVLQKGNGTVNRKSQASDFKAKERMTYLCPLWPHTAHNVDVHQVRHRPERSEARRLRCRPPAGKVTQSSRDRRARGSRAGAADRQEANVAGASNSPPSMPIVAQGREDKGGGEEDACTPLKSMSESSVQYFVLLLSL